MNIGLDWCLQSTNEKYKDAESFVRSRSSGILSLEYSANKVDSICRFDYGVNDMKPKQQQQQQQQRQHSDFVATTIDQSNNNFCQQQQHANIIEDDYEGEIAQGRIDAKGEDDDVSMSSAVTSGSLHPAAVNNDISPPIKTLPTDSSKKGETVASPIPEKRNLASVKAPTAMSSPPSISTGISSGLGGVNIAKILPSIIVDNRGSGGANKTISNIDDDTESEISSISDWFYHPSHGQQQQQQQYTQQYHCGNNSNVLIVRPWDKKKLYSDLVREGIQLINRKSAGKSGNNQNSTISNEVVMLFESPSCSTHETSFFNGQTFKFYDYPPSIAVYKSVLAPCRYSMMNGSVYPSYIVEGSEPDSSLIEHWQTVIPNFITPHFISDIEALKRSTVYAYLPIEHIPQHVNNPHVHYHVSGKDILHLMTRRTPKLLTNTRDRRPCICKTTHSMGSKGIFVIRSDEDERRFESILAETGNPSFVVTEYIDVEQSLSCHFFIHPQSNEITWFGSNRNILSPTIIYDTTDTVFVMKDQERLRQLQLPVVKDVVKYFQSRDFWGFCGVDMLFDKNGEGYLVDVNPRVTGSSPAIMVAHRLYDKFGYDCCIFRRGCTYAYKGTAQQLVSDVTEFNRIHENEILVLLTGYVEMDPTCTLLQLAVYGKNSNLDECQKVLNKFAPAMTKS